MITEKQIQTDIVTMYESLVDDQEWFECRTCAGTGVDKTDEMAVAGELCSEHFYEKYGYETEDPLDPDEQMDELNSYLDDHWDDFREDAWDDFRCVCKTCDGRGTVDWIEHARGN